MIRELSTRKMPSLCVSYIIMFEKSSFYVLGSGKFRFLSGPLSASGTFFFGLKFLEH